MLKSVSLIAVLILLALMIGCSSGTANDPVVPVEIEKHVTYSGTHNLWGMWQFTADPAAGTLDVVPLRGIEMHLNALPFLEPPALLNLTLDSLEFNGSIIDADIGLRHPFLGLTEFTGFDVCGVLISNGSLTGYDDPNLRMAGPGDTRLLNPDGFARWWNPSEFPNNGTMFGYNDGLLGVPDSIGNFNCTLNGYKYFCDDLSGANDPMENVTLANRGMFSAGQKNVRHFTIELGNDGLVFNYAVDANWQFPNGDPPYQAPDDFPMEANRSEAWNISVTEIANTLYYEAGEGGGGVEFQINVFDWVFASNNTVRVESRLDEIPATEISIPTGGGAGYSTYVVDILNCLPTAPGDLELLITIESEDIGYGGLLPGEPVSAYFTYSTTVSDTAPVTNLWSDEFEIQAQDNGRFPVINQTPNGDFIAGWSSNPGVAWSKFTFPDTWDTPGIVNGTNDMAWMSIEQGFSGDDLYLHGGIRVGTTNVNGSIFEIGHGVTWRYNGTGGWDYWNLNSGTALHTHFMNCFENKYHILHGTYASYGYPMHLMWSNWGQYYADYFQDYYDCCNYHEYGYSRCWDDDSTGYMYAAYESDRDKGIYLPKIDYRLVQVAIQYLPSTSSGDHNHFVIDEGSNDYLDSPVIAIDSNDEVHAAYRRYIDASSTWQIVYRWSSDGTSWSSGNETVIWQGNTEPEWRYVSIDVDTQDRIHVSFNTDGDIWYSRSDDGLNWLELEWVNESIDGVSGVADLQQWMVVDQDDQVHVIWARIPTGGAEFGTIRHRWRSSQ